VVVISGGARGVTWHIAKALAPLRSRVVLLGRTALEPAAAYETLRNIRGGGENVLPLLAEKKGARPKGDPPESQEAIVRAGLDIARNVSRLSVLGLKASYLSCDVADPQKVAQTMDQVVKQHGRIDGVIHGAGLVRDAFLEDMTPEDFKRVLGVKLLGPGTCTGLQRTAVCDFSRPYRRSWPSKATWAGKLLRGKSRSFRPP